MNCNLELARPGPDLPGITGDFKIRADHFKVTEIPLYDACGQGDHVFVNTTRSSMETRDLLAKLADIFNLKKTDIGFAGLKDKQAISTQTFSLNMPGTIDTSRISNMVEKIPGVICNWVKLHKNKIKTGHLAGNSFIIQIINIHKDSLQYALDKWEYFKLWGIPNYYGSQRFGRDSNNAALGKKILLGKRKKDKWLNKFLLSAYQSELFNLCLHQRILNDGFEKLYIGDIAKKSDGGGEFLVEDLAIEMDRFIAGEISFTCPMYGKKMKNTGADIKKQEQSILDSQGITINDFSRAGLVGSRRSGRIFLNHFSVEQNKDGLMFCFDLAPGSYASVVINQFMGKNHC